MTLNKNKNIVTCMKPFLTLVSSSLLISLFSACSNLDKIARESERSNTILSQIDTNTRPRNNDSDPSSSMHVDISLPKVNLSTLRSNEVVFDSSVALSENWFMYWIHIRKKTEPTLLHRYGGYFSMLQPDNLFLLDYHVDTSSVSNFVLQDSVLNRINLSYPYRKLALSDVDWQKVLISGGNLEGFLVENRNFNLVDLGRFGLSYSMAIKDTLFGTRAISANQNVRADNSFKEWRIAQSLLENNEWTNWNVIGDPFYKTEWSQVTFRYSDLNNVHFENIKWYKCLLDNLILRHSQYGSITGNEFTECDMYGNTFENAKFDNVSFNSTRIMTAVIRNTKFNATRFSGYSSKPSRFYLCPAIGGEYTECNFGPDLEIDSSTIQFATFKGGKFIQMSFKRSAYIADCTFENTDFFNIRFSNTGLIRTRFSGGNSPTERIFFNGCDFRAVKWGPLLIFSNCDFANCIFPADLTEMRAAGVQFLNCTGAPY